MKQLRGYAVRNQPGGKSTWLASTDTLAMDGLTIDPAGWDLSRFRKNRGPVLWGHDYTGRPPIGIATDARITDAGLVVEIELDETSGDEFARMIAAKVRAGVVSACSVGFDIVRQTGNKVTAARLLELSLVPLGSDENAVALARSRYARSQHVRPSKTVDEALTRLHAALCPPDEMFKIRAKQATRDMIIFAGVAGMNKRQRMRFLRSLTPAQLADVDAITKREAARRRKAA